MARGSVSHEITKILLNYASSTGFDILETLAAIRLDPDRIKDATARVPFAHYQALWNEIVRRSNDEHFGIHFGEQSSFNHAFKRWTGFNPKEYKKRTTIPIIH